MLRVALELATGAGKTTVTAMLIAWKTIDDVVRPERDALEIRFPRVQAYRVKLPQERLTAVFNKDSELTPGLVGPTQASRADPAFVSTRLHQRSDGREGIACRFIDTDYDTESFFVRHADFRGANDP